MKDPDETTTRIGAVVELVSRKEKPPLASVWIVTMAAARLPDASKR
jgi:hypothetical protein